MEEMKLNDKSWRKHAGQLTASVQEWNRQLSVFGTRIGPVHSSTLVVDGNLISSRKQADLPVFAKGMVDWLSSEKSRR